MIYVLLIAMLLLICFHIYMTYNIMIDFCRLMARVERTYDIVSNWAIYYVSKESVDGNNAPFDSIFPHYREEIEKEMKQEECHIDNTEE